VPLVALILGTTAIGAEIDDGTVVHILAKPVGRGWIVLAKILVAAIAGVVLCGTSILVTGLLLIRLDAPGLLFGMIAGSVVAVIAYTAIFVTLSVWTGRALIAGLAYVLLWEGFIASFFAGTRLLSIREYGLAVAAGIAGRDAGTLARDVPLATGLVLAAVVTVIAFVLGARRLARFEISDAG
jgi:ABC-2 type transport system permease protein